MSAADDYAALSDLIARMELDDEEGETFMEQAMGKLGHRAKKLWEDNTEEKAPKTTSLFRTAPAKSTPPARRASGQYPNG